MRQVLRVLHVLPVLRVLVLQVLVLQVLVLQVLILPACGPRLSPHVRVPAEIRNQPPELTPAPNGQPESVRYRVAYEPFWWNCVIVKSGDLSAHCPTSCSGTPAATLGCADGANEADQAVSALRKRHGDVRTKEYLKTLTEKSNALEKIKPYFLNGPVEAPRPK